MAVSTNIILAQDIDLGDFIKLDPKFAPSPSLYDADSCITCGAVSQFSELSLNFADNLSGVLSAPINTLFVSLSVLWVVVAGYRGLFRQETLAQLPKEFAFIALAAAFLGVEGATIIKDLYLAGLELMAGSSEAVLLVINEGKPLPVSEYDGLAHLMFAIEHVFIGNVIGATQLIMHEGSLVNPLPWLYGLVFVVPYFLLVVLYFAKIIVAMFRAMLIAVFSPFLILAAGFNWGRQAAVMGFRTLISSAMVLFAATAAIGICLFSIQKVGIIPDIKIDFAQGVEYASLSNPKFLLAIIMGWLGVGLMTEGVSIANSITGTLLTNTASGVISGGLTATTALMARAVTGPAGMAAVWAGGKISDRSQKLFDQYVGKKPGG